MARTRFAKAVGQSFETPERASVRQALWFDVEAAEIPDDDSLADARVSLFDRNYDIVFSAIEHATSPATVVTRRVFTLERSLFAAPSGWSTSCASATAPREGSW